MITKIDSDNCTGCGTCVKSCSLDVFTLDTGQDNVAPCMAACPCEADVRGIMYLLQQDRHEEALEVIRQAIPFPLITGLLCTRPCESACIRHQNGAAVNIRALEHFLGLRDIDDYAPPCREHLARVAVIGSGLAGLACAYFLRNLGYPVTIFEAAPEAGGWLRTALPPHVLGSQLARLRNLGVSIRYNTVIGPHGDLGFGSLLQNFSACCVAAGQGSSALQIHVDSEPLARSVDPKTMQTAIERIFAAGAVCGTTDVAGSIAQAKRAADCMDRWLRGADFFSADPEPRRIENHLPPVLPTWPRQEDSEQGLSLEAAQVESLRCLTCGSKARITHTDDCMTCFSCELSCPCQAITVHPFKEALPRTLQISAKDK